MHPSASDEPFQAVVVDCPGVGPYTLEARALSTFGGKLTVIALEELQTQPLRVDALVNAGSYPLGERELDRLIGCRCILGYGIGVDWIDVELAANRGMLVVNTPLANVEEVGVHALALVLACARRLREYDEHIRHGGFYPPWSPLRRLSGRTLGFLSFGNTAQQLSSLATPLGFAQQAYAPTVSPEVLAARGVRAVELETLLATSDILSVHIPASPGAPPVLDARRVALIREGAIVVVTSRGAVYDAEALAAALASRRIAAAGLDVFPEEPLPAGHPLTKLENVILTPHVAGHSLEAEVDAHSWIATQLAALARHETPQGVVTLKSVDALRRTHGLRA